MKKAEALEFAILGILQDGPIHGYELRKRLNQVLGSLRVISFGSLYPALKKLRLRGDLIERAEDVTPRRRKIVYAVTPNGSKRFATMLANAGPDAWDDETFGLHFSFFSRSNGKLRLQILEGRRLRIAQRRAVLHEFLEGPHPEMDSYTLELQRHGLEILEHELRWLDGLIAAESKNND